MIIWQLKRLIYRMAMYYQSCIKPKMKSPISKYLYNDDPHIHNAAAIGKTIKKLKGYRFSMGYYNLKKRYLKENLEEKLEKQKLYISANPYNRGM